jgi:hypothetical protein
MCRVNVPISKAVPTLIRTNLCSTVPFYRSQRPSGNSRPENNAAAGRAEIACEPVSRNRSEKPTLEPLLRRAGQLVTQQRKVRTHSGTRPLILEVTHVLFKRSEVLLNHMC